MWRDDAARLRFQPKVGMEVLAAGRVQVYVERGKYQFYATSLQPLGQGVLELAFRQLKEKLEREGLFAARAEEAAAAVPGAGGAGDEPADRGPAGHAQGAAVGSRG